MLIAPDFSKIELIICFVSFTCGRIADKLTKALITYHILFFILWQILDLTQKEFGERISVKGNTKTQYELGKNKPIDSVLSLICREFNVNAEWLRMGTGEMFRAIPSDELDKLALKYNLSHRDYIFIEYLLKDVNAKITLENFCMDFATTALSDNIPENTPPMPNDSIPILNISKLEEAYKKSFSVSVPKTTFSVSSITDEKHLKKVSV